MTRSTLPVRSPLPNRQPSMRSAPAITANSAAATAVPRSLCGCTLNTMLSRRARFLLHPPDLVGVHVGRSRLDGGRQVEHHLCAGAWRSHSSATALETSSANSGSVVLKTSGRVTRSAIAFAGTSPCTALTMRVPVTAMFLISSRLMLNTICGKPERRCVARWIMACQSRRRPRRCG